MQTKALKQRHRQRDKDTNKALKLRHKTEKQRCKQTLKQRCKQNSKTEMQTNSKTETRTETEIQTKGSKDDPEHSSQELPIRDALRVRRHLEISGDRSLKYFSDLNTNKQMHAWKKETGMEEGKDCPKLLCKEQIDGYSKTESLFRDLGMWKALFF
ncbi:hypothetical protein CEXT_266331 [Caerostris extrusa]|uniref:Uncharacterized protein n=1 Tax=Caerostris extrusa TaxID=172846 RepID=A0AAV4QIN7_CAEEX|nr:hypothetical protein CEXT_266331 [Caerostris extrusa]